MQLFKVILIVDKQKSTRQIDYSLSCFLLNLIEQRIRVDSKVH